MEAQNTTTEVTWELLDKADDSATSLINPSGEHIVSSCRACLMAEFHNDDSRSPGTTRRDSRPEAECGNLVVVTPRPDAMCGPLDTTPPEPGGPCSLQKESRRSTSPGIAKRLSSDTWRHVLLPRSPVSGTTVHCGIPRCMSSPGDQSLASACAQLQDQDMILDLSELSACTDVLGQGAMGVLYAATLHHKGTERAVAVKHRLPSATAGGSGSESMRDVIWSMLMGAKIKPRKSLSPACDLCHVQPAEA